MTFHTTEAMRASLLRIRAEIAGLPDDAPEDTLIAVQVGDIIVVLESFSATLDAVRANTVPR